MGLVVAPALSVLPVAATLDPAVPASQSAGTADATVTDTFAALLAMLAQSGPTVPVKALVDPGVASPDATAAPVKPNEDTTSEASPLAAALAAMLLLPAAVPASSADPATTPALAGSASPTTTVETARAAPLSASLPQIPPVPGLPGSSGSNTAATVAIGAETEPSLPAFADAVRSTIATIAEAPLPPGASATAAAPTEGSVRKPPAEAQPPGTPAPQGVEISVVRSVGNAQQTQTTGDGADGSANSGQKHDTAVPKPDGQLTSSTIAVAAPTTTVAPSAAAAAPQAVPGHAPPQPVEQVARTVIDTAEHGGGEVHIRLDPPELGAVTIHVRIDGYRVQVQVQAERSDAMNLLRQSTIDLSSLLGNRGLHLTDVNVGLGGHQAPGGDQPNPNQAGPAANGEFASILGIDHTPVAELHNRLQSAYNPDGLHIYRV